MAILIVNLMCRSRYVAEWGAPIIATELYDHRGGASVVLDVREKCHCLVTRPALYAAVATRVTCCAIDHVHACCHGEGG
jgi:hypothetical protein